MGFGESSVLLRGISTNQAGVRKLKKARGLFLFVVLPVKGFVGLGESSVLLGEISGNQAGEISGNQAEGTRRGRGG